jgi:hypothetical protein
MATEAAWLKGNRLTEERKRKRALTTTGLLMEGLSAKIRFRTGGNFVVSRTGEAYDARVERPTRKFR